MLTRELAIAEFDSGRVFPDRLTRVSHAQYGEYAQRLLAIYRNGIGRTRQQLHQSVHAIFENEFECPIRRINAFCKLLDEQSEFERDRKGRAAQLRRRVFRLAASCHPLVKSADQLFETAEEQVKSDIAEKLARSWSDIERSLFADVIQFHRLSKFHDDQTPAEFLARYNVSQCQAVLYDAISMTVWAREDFKTILRYAKLARLMHTIDRQSDGQNVIKFDGPSSVLRQTRRYGVGFAKFLPALLTCSGWKMQAVIQHRRSCWQNLFRLSPRDGLSSHLSTPDEFDSQLEANFAQRWGDEPHDGWQMTREGELLHENQKVFVPDFVFEHASGRRVLLEIVGFWTPEYLAAKQETLKQFSQHRILLAIADSVDWPADSTRGQTVIRYKTAIKVSDVLARLNLELHH